MIETFPRFSRRDECNGENKTVLIALDLKHHNNTGRLRYFALVCEMRL